MEVVTSSFSSSKRINFNNSVINPHDVPNHSSYINADKNFYYILNSFIKEGIYYQIEELPAARQLKISREEKSFCESCNTTRKYLCSSGKVEYLSGVNSREEVLAHELKHLQDMRKLADLKNSIISSQKIRLIYYTCSSCGSEYVGRGEAITEFIELNWIDGNNTYKYKKNITINNDNNKALSLDNLGRSLDIYV